MALHFFPRPNDDEKRVRETARDLCTRFIRPYSIPDDQNCHFRRQAFEELGRAGLVALIVPEEYGGGNASYQTYYASLEEISRASLAIGVSVGVTNLLMGAILQFGTHEQKTHFLPRLAKGEWLGAFSLSEPQSGSDASALKLSAKPVADGYRFNGTKAWCSNAGSADLYLVMARTGEEKAKGITSFLVPKDVPGFRVGKQEDKLGLRGSKLAELIFEDCFIPNSMRLGAEGQGFTVALSQLDLGRVGIGVSGFAAGVESLERAWIHLTRRAETTNRPFSEGAKHLLGEHYASLQAVRLLIAQAAELRNAGERITTLSSQIKLLATDLAMRISGDVVEMLEEEGYRRENEFERIMRDVKALQIVEGTNQIQRIVLARALEKAFSLSP